MQERPANLISINSRIASNNFPRVVTLQSLPPTDFFPHPPSYLNLLLIMEKKKKNTERKTEVEEWDTGKSFSYVDVLLMGSSNNIQSQRSFALKTCNTEGKELV